MKATKCFVFFILTFLLSTPVLAKESGANVNTNSQLSNTNQIQTRNQGQSTQIQVANQESTKAGTQSGKANQVQVRNQDQSTQIQVKNQENQNISSKAAAPRSQSALEHRSAVSAKVEELLTTRSAKGGIGPQVSEFAQSQMKDEEEISVATEKLETRSKLLKKLIGPDYKQLKALEKIQERNQQRIQLLEQLQTKVSNAGDLTKIKEMIALLKQENNSLANQIKTEKNYRSFFGWLFQIFSK